LERQKESLIARGMSPAAARAAALREFGGLEQAREQCREARGVRLLEDLLQDLRYGSRTLRRRPLFTIVAVATLALGIRANAVMFRAVHGVLLRALPYPDADRILFVHSSNPARGASLWGTSPPDYYAMRAENRSFTHLAASYRRSYNLTGDGEPERL